MPWRLVVRPVDARLTVPTSPPRRPPHDRPTSTRRTLAPSSCPGCSNLDARSARPARASVGHLDSLQVLCEDEASRRATAAIGRRLRADRFDQQVSLEELDFTVLRDARRGDPRPGHPRVLDAGESVVLHGPALR